MNVQDIAEKIRVKAEDAGFDKRVKFDLGGDGAFVLNGSTVEDGSAEADCVISLSQSDLSDLLSGDLNPTAAFMTGKLKVDGDMSAAMAVAQLI